MTAVEPNQLIAEAIDIARDAKCIHVIGGSEFAGAVNNWFRSEEKPPHLLSSVSSGKI